MEKIKTFNSAERQTYVPASVKVIETSVQRVICTSPNGTEPYERESWN